MTTTDDNASWKGDVWIDDNWTAEDKAKALELIGSDQAKQPLHHLDEEQQQRNLALNEFRRNASTNWNSFYEQNQTNFFKDRHYLHKAFPNEFAWLYAHSSDNNEELDESGNPRLYSIPNRIKTEESRTIVEIGCGVGNAILPLLEQHTELMHKYSSLDDDNDDVPPPRLNIHCLDFAPTAINFLTQDPRFRAAEEEGRATAHVFDLSSMHPSTISTSAASSTNNDKKQSTTLANSADVAILLFCLSAVAPHPSAALSRAARHAMDILKPGGTLVIRDYGRLDEAQMKLSKGEKSLGNNFYRKGDGTGCYYFELQDLKDLFVNNDDDCTKLELLELDYIQRVYRNRGDNSTRRRVWIQGRFRKPFGAGDESKYDLPSIGGIERYSSTACKRWDNYYSTLAKMKTSTLPSNLFQIFPNEFSPWQSLMKQQNKGRPQNAQSLETSYSVSDNVTIVDLACGLGNASLLNLIQTLHQQTGQEESPRVNVNFLDISSEAIRQLSNDQRYQSGISSDSVVSQVYDVRTPLTIPKHLDQSVDIVLLLFALSAIGPYKCDDLKNAVTNAVKMLKPGGVILFRDYGRYDDDQLQLNSVSGAQICNNFYLRGVDGDDDSKVENRSDTGTGCYFFELDEVRDMFAELEVLQLECTTRTYKKTGKSAKDLNKNGGAAERRRMWIQGRFRKPVGNYLS